MKKLNISKETVIGIMLLSLVCSAFLFKPLTAHAAQTTLYVDYAEPYLGPNSGWWAFQIAGSDKPIIFFWSFYSDGAYMTVDNYTAQGGGYQFTPSTNSGADTHCTIYKIDQAGNVQALAFVNANNPYHWYDGVGRVPNNGCIFKGTVRAGQNWFPSFDLEIKFSSSTEAQNQLSALISMDNQLRNIYSTLQTISQTQLMNINGNLSAILNQFLTFFQFYQDNFGSASVTGNNLLGWLYEIYDLLEQLVNGTGDQQQAVQDAVDKIDEVTNGFDNDSFQQSHNDSTQMYGNASSNIDGAINDISSITDPLNDAVSGNGASGVLLSSLRLFVEDKYIGTMITAVGILCVFSYLVFGKRE